jgi:CpcD/allophycocyanin linker domain
MIIQISKSRIRFMATMTVTAQSTDVTAYGSLLATLEVTGISTRQAHQTITVPLSRLSQKMQQINRHGGKILSVNTGSVLPARPHHVSSPVTTAEIMSAVEAIEPSISEQAADAEQEQELVMETPTPAVRQKQQNSSKKKRR